MRIFDIGMFAPLIEGRKSYDASGKMKGQVDPERTRKSVTMGLVYWDYRRKASCREHGAMNASNPECTIWRCYAIGCGAALYAMKG